MTKDIKNNSDNREGMQLKSQETQAGFIAQDVEAATQRTGFDFSGVLPLDGSQDTYRLRYTEFVVPLVKAVQELNDQVEDQQAIIYQQQEVNENLQSQIDALKAIISKK